MIQLYPGIKLKPGKERSVKNFHPWIFSGAVATDIKRLEEGSVVEVTDSEGNYLATGHYHKASIMVRVLSFEQRAIDETFWNEKIKAAIEVRKLFRFAENYTNTYRLIHGEGDGLPGMIVDVYDKHVVIQAHTTGMQKMLPIISDALNKNLDSLSTIYARNPDAGAEGTYLLGNSSHTVVTENGHQFHVNWQEGQKTGFFLDQRDNRLLLSNYVRGKKVLNTFCYSGGFSIYALKAGASYVDSVDSSRKAIEWTDMNVMLNFGENAPHHSHCEDVFDFLKISKSEYDIIVLDPPAFAKHLSAADKAVIGYRNLNMEAIKSIRPGGLIFTFSCSQAIDKQLFRKTVFTAAAKTRRNVTILHQLSQGADHPVSLYHPEGEYLKGLVLEVM